jgi:hypothetical protein
MQLQVIDFFCAQTLLKQTHFVQSVTFNPINIAWFSHEKDKKSKKAMTSRP